MNNIPACNNIAFYPIVNEKTELLPVFCCGIGINPLQEERNRPEGFPKHHLFIVLKGRGRLFCEEQVFSAEEGSCFFIKKEIPHRYFADGTEFQTGWLTFEGFGCEKLFAYAGVDRFCFRMQSDPALTERFHALYHKLRSYQSEREAAVLLYDFVHYFLEQLTDNRPARQASPAAATEYIRTHYMKDITLDDLAGSCRMSRSAFCRSFKTVFRETPFEYVLRTRISAAKKLLVEQPDCSIREIGELTGFHDTGYFCRTFRRLEGMSPGAFRRIAG